MDLVDDETIEQCVQAILAENPAWTRLVLDYPSTESLEAHELRLRIFGALVESQRFDSLKFDQWWKGRHAVSMIPQWLDRTLPTSSFEMINLGNISSMIPADARETGTFQRIKRSDVSMLLVSAPWNERHVGAGIMNALVDCLQNRSPITSLSLAFHPLSEENVSEEVFQSLCSSLRDCPSLTSLSLSNLVVGASDVLEKPSEAFSNAIVNSSLTKVCITGHPGTVSVQTLFRTLARSDAVLNHDSLMVSRDGDSHIKIDRTCTRVILSDFIAFFHERYPSHGLYDNEQIQECVENILARKVAWEELTVDVSNRNRMQDWSRILQAVASSQRFESLVFNTPIDDFLASLLSACSMWSCQQ